MPSIDNIYEDNDYEDDIEYEDEFEEEIDTFDSDEQEETNENHEKLIINEVKEEKDSHLKIYLNHGTGVALGLWNPSIKVSAIPFDVPTTTSKYNNTYGFTITSTLIIASFISFIASGFPPNDVVFEELAIGKAINTYYKRKFTLISEPPLTLLIYYLISRLTSNYSGDFKIREIGQIYDENFPYIQLRSFNILLGLSSIYLTFKILQQFSINKTFVCLGTIAIMLENSFHTQQMYFFSQPILQFFTISSIYYWKKSYIYEYRNFFSRSWFINIFLMSFSLGCTISCRNFGSSTLAFVLLTILYQLWWTLTDTKINIKMVLLAYSVKISLIVFIPFLIFISSWMVHLHLTPNIGFGDHEMSGSFQSSLIGSSNTAVPLQISYGSFVTIRNKNIHGYLHSHDVFYPTASYQQQVSLYQFKDINNLFLIEPSLPLEYEGEEPHPVRNGDMIRLVHVPTNRRLHSHSIKAHVSEQDWSHEVSAYGADGYSGDLNDIWVLEILEDSDKLEETQGQWQAISSVVRFRHFLSGCYLFTHRIRLPSWGMDQFEVTCVDAGKVANSLWMVETNFHPRYNNSKSIDFIEYKKLSLAEKFIEYSEVIDDIHDNGKSKGILVRYGLSPYELPFLPEVVKYLVLKQFGIQVSLFGNPINWYTAIFSVTSYIIFKVVLMIGVHRNWIILPYSQEIVRMDHDAGHLLIGWLVHFIRIIPRSKENLDISDYLPSLYFSILFTMIVNSYAFETFLNGTRRVFNIRNCILTLWGIAIICGFTLYLPLMNGSSWDSELCEKANFRNWGFQCFIYTEEFQELHSKPNSMIEKIFTTISQDADDEDGDEVQLDYSEVIVNDQFTPRLDIQDPEVRGILLEYLRKRKFDKDEGFLELFPELNNTVISATTPSSTSTEIESSIVKQWSRITSPAKVNNTL